MKKLSYFIIFCTWIAILNLAFPVQADNFFNQRVAIIGSGGRILSCVSCDSSSDNSIASINSFDTQYQDSAVTWVSYRFTINTPKCITGGIVAIGDNSNNVSVDFEIYNNDGATDKPTSIVDSGFTSTINQGQLPSMPTDGSTEILFASSQALSVGTYHAVFKIYNISLTYKVGYQASGGSVVGMYYSTDNGVNWSALSPAIYMEVLGCDI
jgi:hypothetical protein